MAEVFSAKYTGTDFGWLWSIVGNAAYTAGLGGMAPSLSGAQQLAAADISLAIARSGGTVTPPPGGGGTPDPGQSALAAHVGALDPHTQYLNQLRGDVRYADVVRVKAGDPTAADLALGAFAIYHDSASGATKLWANFDGLSTVQLLSVATPGGATVPGAPTAVMATNAATAPGATTGGAWVGYTPPVSNGNSPITNYRVTVSPGGAVVDFPVGGLGHAIMGLTFGQAYTFVVTATNAIGMSAPSVASAPFTPTTPVVPGVPLGLAASPGNGQVTLTWAAPTSDGGSPLRNYVVYASPGALQWMVGAEVTALVASGLSNGQAYTFWIAALNIYGGGAQSGPVLATPTGAALPAGLSVPPHTEFQWQLTGTVDTQNYRAGLFDIDGFDNAAGVVTALKTRWPGCKVYAYFSFGTWEPGRPDSATIPSVVQGNAVEGWAAEHWLDIRRLDILGPIMTARMDLAKAKGFDGIEPDNIDGYSNSSGFALSASDQITYNTWIAAQAHARGLGVCLKNSAEQVGQLVGLFDFAIAEECFRYGEADSYTPFVAAGKAVFAVEYISSTYSNHVADANSRNFDLQLKTMDLGAPRTEARAYP